MDILEQVKTRLLATKKEEDINITLISSIVLEVEQFILNYCNILEVPIELKWVWVRLVLADYNMQTEEKLVTTSASEGGRTITKSGSTPASVENFRMQEITNNTKLELNRHRLVYKKGV